MISHKTFLEILNTNRKCQLLQLKETLGFFDARILVLK